MWRNRANNRLGGLLWFDSDSLESFESLSESRHSYFRTYTMPSLFLVSDSLYRSYDCCTSLTQSKS